MTVMT
jgi:hypothetical protein